MAFQKYRGRKAACVDRIVRQRLGLRQRPLKSFLTQKRKAARQTPSSFAPWHLCVLALNPSLGENPCKDVSGKPIVATVPQKSFTAGNSEQLSLRGDVCVIGERVFSSVS
jgi:hypothetical protein